jgi:hypothetical protein
LTALRKKQRWKIEPHGLFPAYVAKNITCAIGVTRDRLAGLPEREE